MSIRCLVVVAGIFLSACSDNTTKPKAPDVSSASVAKPQVAVEPGAGQAATSPVSAPRPQVDPRIVQYRDKMNVFLEEASSLTRYLDSIPERVLYKKKLDLVTDAHTRIPDPPSGFEPCSELARQIEAGLSLGDFAVKLLDDAQKSEWKDGMDKAADLCRKSAADIKPKIAQIRAAIGG